MKNIIIFCFLPLSWQMVWGQKTTDKPAAENSFCNSLKKLEKLAAANFKPVNNNTVDKKELHYYNDYLPLSYDEIFYNTSLKLPGFDHCYISGGVQGDHFLNLVPPETYVAVSIIRFPNAKEDSVIALKKINGLKAKIAACLPGYTIEKETRNRNDIFSFAFIVRYTFTKKNNSTNAPVFELKLQPGRGDKYTNEEHIVFSVTGTGPADNKESTGNLARLVFKSTNESKTSETEIEITKDDLAKYPGISSDKISVAGIRLGMNKEEIIKIIEKRNWGYEEKYDPLTSENRFIVNDKLSLLGTGPTNLFRLEWNITDNELKAITFFSDFKDYVKGETKKLFASEAADPNSGFIKSFLGATYRTNTTNAGITEETEYDYYTRGFKITISKYRNYDPTVTFCIYKQ
jgi:hypothetical protein